MKSMATVGDRQHCFTTAELALKFIMSGNAYVTLVSKLTGVRYTYRISKCKEDNADQNSLWPQKKQQKPAWFVSLLAGQDNTSDYVYLGLIEDNKVFRLTRKSRMSSQSLPVVAFSYAMTNLVKNIMPNQLEVWHHGRCGHCGKMLTVPEYKVNGVVVAGVAMGIGPECAGL